MFFIIFISLLSYHTINHSCLNESETHCLISTTSQDMPRSQLKRREEGLDFPTTTYTVDIHDNPQNPNNNADPHRKFLIISAFFAVSAVTTLTGATIAHYSK